MTPDFSYVFASYVPLFDPDAFSDLHLVISDEFTPATAAEALELGACTIVTPSNLYESAPDPLALAAELHARLLRRP